MFSGSWFWPTPAWSCPAPPHEVFSRAAELEAVGLSVPQVTKVAMELRRRGVAVDASVYTVEDLYRSLTALRKGGAPC